MFNFIDHHRCRFSMRMILLSGVAASAVLCSAPSFADPSITYTGAVNPPPPQGVTNWDRPDGGLQVGDSDSGTLNIMGGASVTSQNLLIGYWNLSDPASVTVDGKGSTLSVTTGGITIGDEFSDSATLTVSNGGRVDSLTAVGNNIVVGAEAGSTGHLIITGQGSVFNAHDNVIAVGYQGDGDLTVADGGQVTGYQLYLGNTQTGVGTATISGNGSAWNGQHGIWVGQFGTGTLNLSDGGSINDNSLQIAYDTGTHGTVNVGGAAGEAAKASGNLNVNTIVFNRNGGGSTGVLNFNTTDGTTVHAAISGVGTINQIAGTTVFTGDNSAFAGTMNITGGALQLGNGGTTGNLAVDVSTGTDATHKGTLAFDRSDAVTFSNVVSGTGSLVQMGTGTTTLTKDNSYSGGTTISGGTLSVASDAKLGDAAGGLTLNGGTLQVTGTQFTSTARSMTLGDQGGGFDIADAGNTFTVTQQLTGQGAVWKRGDGTLVLSGDNSFAGGLTVEGALQGLVLPVTHWVPAC
ncbi:autotransporter-associated beta strand repeat-containing protein [Ochrobactrum sp. CGA5]|uniref:autotransporter outer membrane beta-barrel domain-containing protein n=1 Tax=Ochrobactrum sp. CGA5 TaxID=2583453 RepID=UPI001FFF5FBA|nr:autotransporter-associated beta strand repeat-containing protein [Ochrobactrum sp. CGA5]